MSVKKLTNDRIRIAGVKIAGIISSLLSLDQKEDASFPDLIIIDGGKLQLDFAVDVLALELSECMWRSRSTESAGFVPTLESYLSSN